MKTETNQNDLILQLKSLLAGMKRELRDSHAYGVRLGEELTHSQDVCERLRGGIDRIMDSDFSAESIVVIVKSILAPDHP